MDVEQEKSELILKLTDAVNRVEELQKTYERYVMSFNHHPVAAALFEKIAVDLKQALDGEQ